MSTFPVCLQLDDTCNVDNVTVAESVVVTDDGNTAIYTDFGAKVIGMVDISDASNPAPLGTVDLPGEPASIAIRGDHVLISVNTNVGVSWCRGLRP